ncbi:MAG: UDP-N-acetylmuramate dehydrogenase [Candidatus Pacebacteria bacterium]|nr:UDP-N-acetylmuramate dehydrogenase [Candidatus Paceibacterota bacterium]MBP9715821.1 UDP-N-acetylmuramate dehydrogenase [Candidatus Paceibacterota bacterium]
MEILEYVDSKGYCTLASGGKFRYMAKVSDPADLKNIYLFAQEKGIRVLPLGGGSNLVFNDDVLNVLALKAEIFGFDILDEDDNYTTLKIGAGENWDKFVERVCSMGLSGVEAMSAIPGTMGATPVQNVGAYGQEIKDTLISVDVFDTIELEYKTLSKEDCKFRYRDSIFKTEEKGRYFITSVTLQLSKNIPEIPNYPGVKKYFLENNINSPSLIDIRNAIMDIRASKLPNPAEIPNVGSFFENPIVDKSIFEKLKILYHEIPSFPVSARQGLAEENNLVKIPAGWLIENAGLKGHNFGHVSVYEKNALVLVNNGDATGQDFANARDQIIKTVFDKFGITLEQEPEIIK